MKVLVTGATGLVGRQICLKLIERGDELVVLTTRSEETFRESFTYPCQYFHWDQVDQLPLVDSVIHLAGDNIAAGRWTKSKKDRIVNSRIQPTEKLLQSFRDNNSWPKSFISTSAIGFYGDRGSEFLTEDSPSGGGFLAEVCRAWEGTAKIAEKKCRLVILRVGVVLDVKGGFLGKLEPLFSSNLGGQVGDGKQWMSWIHIQDLINMYLYCVDSKELKGTFNAVAPHPVTNSHFTKSYAEKLKVAKLLTAPKIGIKLLMGEMSQLALSSQNVRSDKIQHLGFHFQFEKIEEAFADLYSWKKKGHQMILIRDQWIAKPRNRVFPFFSKAENLEKITPPFLKFKILNTTQNPIEKGTLIDYKLNVHGLPIKWRTEIEQWEPESKFVDNQLKGPYKYWHHTHTFKELKNGTLMQDQVIYELPFGKIGLSVAGMFVQKDVESIFKFRTKAIRKIESDL